MNNNKGSKLETKVEKSSLESQKIELIKLRIKNKYYDRDEILQKVVQEMYERDIRKNTMN
jgi:hypothetical protein